MKVSIFGNDYAVIFNMAVQIAFEDESGMPFDLDNMKTQKSTLQLCYASLKEANEKLPFTFDELIKKMSAKEAGDLKNAVISAMTDWFAMPAVMAGEVPANPDEPKNA